MKTPTHTPGPWATSRDAVPEWHTQITVYEEATGKRVATVFETPANARLIAAAPDLLDALRYMVTNAEADGWSSFMLGQARDVLNRINNP